VSSKADKPEWVSGRDDVTTTVTKLLERRENTSGKHYKLLDILANPFYLEKCYNEIMSKPGNMTKGLTNETLDGINWKWFEKTAEDLKSGKFNFSPNRRIEIPKSNGKMRPLGIGTPREKIIQKGIHGILEAIFDPIFLSTSNGFRRKKSVHTALADIYLKGSKHNWVIQGDISKCFDKIPHTIIMKLVRKEIGDPRLLELVKKFISAGYVDEDGKLHQPTEGTPQGGVLSPLLSNIVLHQLDLFMDDEKKRFDKGTKRRKNPTYAALQNKKARTTDPLERSRLLSEMRKLRRSDMFDPNFRRLNYTRYADDFVVLIVGSLKNAEFIKKKIKEVLKGKCGLDLNDDKTIINKMTDKWHFLGAEIRNLKADSTFLVGHGQGRKARGIARTLVSAPIDKILEKLKKANFIRQNHKGKYLPRGYTPMMNLSHHEVVTFFSAKIRGVINFYKFAANRSSLYSINWLIKASCALTLAKKYKLRTMSQVFKKFGPDLTCPEIGTKYHKVTGLKAIHDYGKKKEDSVDRIISQTWAGKDTKSAFNESCTVCGSQQFIEMHHIRTVKNIRARYRDGEKITRAQFDGAIMRKQVPLCSYHHILLHKGELNWADLARIHKYNKHGK
jgi:group II intron reverse transcriptase/maturase